jgi:hypothetical protein
MQRLQVRDNCVGAPVAGCTGEARASPAGAGDHLPVGRPRPRAGASARREHAVHAAGRAASGRRPGEARCEQPLAEVWPALEHARMTLSLFQRDVRTTADVATPSQRGAPRRAGGFRRRGGDVWHRASHPGPDWPLAGHAGRRAGSAFLTAASGPRRGPDPARFPSPRPYQSPCILGILGAEEARRQEAEPRTTANLYVEFMTRWFLMRSHRVPLMPAPS